ncbi:VacJ family lipoprotein [Roseomonas sp. OT10]|uniref:MlaA family lipoprotein n=1 Tax=Roseomonas cutis TaxID=2897332 RepID=UPI001E63DB53|nr:VacJ family lipoprotein [Roseomonas sp. OT10]UFN49561.1 VacJ family lipoprotein [Roseomonas sp. OT10]
MRPLRFLALVLVLGVSACATRPPADDPEAIAEFEQTNDPAEPTNRVLFAIHQGIDQVVLRPAAQAYRAVVPPPVRRGVSNVLGNLRSPVIALNDALQGETQRFGTTMGRFLLNSTIGLGGIFDVASDLGLPPHNSDFGQTLGKAGLGEGPFLFIPILGPSNPRDLLGQGVDTAANPFTYLNWGDSSWTDVYRYGRTGLTVLDTRESLLDAVDAVNETSLDPYATFRSAYRQQRQRAIQSTGQSDPAGIGTGLGVGTGVYPER